MARRRRRNPEELPYNEWVPAHAVMFKDDGTVDVMTEGSSALSNPVLYRGKSEERASEILKDALYTGKYKGLYRRGPRPDDPEWLVGYNYEIEPVSNPSSGFPYHYTLSYAGVGGGKVSSDAIVAAYEQLGVALPAQLRKVLTHGVSYSNENFDAMSGAMRELERDYGIPHTRLANRGRRRNAGDELLYSVTDQETGLESIVYRTPSSTLGEYKVVFRDVDSDNIFSIRHYDSEDNARQAAYEFAHAERLYTQKKYGSE